MESTARTERGTGRSVPSEIIQSSKSAAEHGVEDAHGVGQIDIAEMLPFAHPAGVQEETIDVRVALEDVVEQVGMFGAIAGDKGVVEEFILDRAGLGWIAGRGLHGLSQDHEGGRLFVGEFGDGGYDVSAGDNEEVIDARALMSLPACMKSRRSTTARPLEVISML